MREAVLPRRYANDFSKIRKNSQVGRLINIGETINGKFICVGQHGYFERLWESFNKIRLLESRNPLLEETWIALAKNNKSYTLHKDNFPAGKYSVYELATDDFVAPVFGEDVLSCIDGQEYFFPSSFYKSPKSPCVYKDSPDPDYTAKLPLSAEMDVALFDTTRRFRKPVNLWLHPFIFYRKWHYGTLKHVIRRYFRKKKVAQESLYWKKILGTDTDPKIDFSIFKNCKPNAQNTSCNDDKCRELNLFPSVHKIIEKFALAYSKNFVTSLQNADTIQVAIWNRDNHPDYYVRLAVGSSAEKNLKELSIWVGYSYDMFDDVVNIHIAPLTFYLTDSKVEFKAEGPEDNRFKLWGLGNASLMLKK